MQFGHEEDELVSKEEELLLDESSFFAQEMTLRLKRNTEKITGIYLTRFPITGQSR